MLVPTLLNVVLAGSSSLVAAEVLNTAWLRNDGEPQGSLQNISGVSLYFARPPANISARADKAVLLLPDIYGLAIPYALRMADSYARAGYFTVAVDTFSGDPAPYPLTSDPDFDLAAWWPLPEVVDPILETVIEYVRNTLGYSGVGIAGYCYGGYYSARFLAENRTIRADASFAVTPSQSSFGVTDTLDEIALVSGPITYAFAGMLLCPHPLHSTSMADILKPPEIDNRMPRELVNDIVDTLNNSRATAAPYQSVVYGNSNHGFGLRGEILNLQADNSSNPEEVFAKESAFLQAVRWFDTYL